MSRMEGVFMTDDELEQFDTDDEMMEDKLHWHFDAVEMETWQEVLREGARVYTLLFDCDIVRGTPIHAVLTAITFAAWEVGKKNGDLNIVLEDLKKPPK